MKLFKKKTAQSAPDLKAQADVILKKPASEPLSKEEKRILHARISEIKKYANDENTVQNSIPYMCIFKDGICQVSENFFSMTVQFFDANYVLADFEEQNNIFSKYCLLLNSFVFSSRLKIKTDQKIKSLKRFKFRSKMMNLIIFVQNIPKCSLLSY